ncbi:hypothetical protein J4409_00690 [Candidatus Woesearchaeota archaeon]|nr:hypothetical protein [Candidatus Woesearchaeota archaeon]
MIKLEEIVNLNKLHGLNRCLKDYETGLKESDTGVMRDVSKVVAKITDYVPELFINAPSPQSWRESRDTWVDNNEKNIDKELEAAKCELLTFYANKTNKAIEEIIEKVKEDISKKFKGKVPDDVIQESIKVNVYENLLPILSEFELSQEYLNSKDADKDLVEGYNAYKKLAKSKPAERSEMIADAMIKMRGMPAYAKDIVRDWNRYGGELLDINSRLLSKGLLNNDLKLDKDKFDKAFGTRDNYAMVAAMYANSRAGKKK